VTRVAVVVVALVALAWLGVMERAERLQASGATEADYRAARLLNPDTVPDVRRAFLYQGTGREREAAALLEDVLRREPDNLDAWGLLYTFTRERDPATARRALAARARLDPLGAR
jgi:predicted Zn-dependent protease